MATRTHERDVIVNLFPDQEPVGFYVTLPASRQVSGEPVLPVASFQGLLHHKSADHRPQFVQVFAAASRKPDIPAEPRGSPQPHALVELGLQLL